MAIAEGSADRQEPEVPDQFVGNYRRPAALGGPAHPDGDVVSIRWFGTATFELAFGDKVILLDNFYDRPARNRSLGFDAAEVTRADYILVGHPHFDHVADTARVARQTGAPVAIAPIGVDYLLSGPGFTVTALHAYHLDFGLTPALAQKWQALRAAQAAFDAEFTPPPPRRTARPHCGSHSAACTLRRSTPKPRSATSSASTGSGSPTGIAAGRSATRSLATSRPIPASTSPSCRLTGSIRPR
jgi:hypothetical protein